MTMRQNAVERPRLSPMEQSALLTVEIFVVMKRMLRVRRVREGYATEVWLPFLLWWSWESWQPGWCSLVYGRSWQHHEMLDAGPWLGVNQSRDLNNDFWLVVYLIRSVPDGTVVGQENMLKYCTATRELYLEELVNIFPLLVHLFFYYKYKHVFHVCTSTQQYEKF